MQSKNSPLEDAYGLIGSWIQEVFTEAPQRLDVQVLPGDLPQVVEALVEARWGYLSAISGLDLGGEEQAELEVLYHFCAGSDVLTVRIPLPYENPVVESITGLIPAAIYYERELMEMFGVDVRNAPNKDRLFLPDNWPDDAYPLRRSFEPGQKASPSAVPVKTKDSSNRFRIPIGPQHPALKEPAHFEFEVYGEIVKGATVRLGYVHRGIEKAAEQRTWIQNLYLLERVCGICSHIHASTFARAAEALAEVEVPPRAEGIRTIVAELERIHSHLLWLGLAAHDAGFEALFMYSWRDRETIMDILETLTGNRVNYSVNVLGGVKYDITDDIAGQIMRGLEYLEERTHYYHEVVTTDAVFLQRIRGVGIMTAPQAEAWGVVGPLARASGIERDIRREAPYWSYTDHPVNRIFSVRGDLEARFVVRIQELFESYRLIRDILDDLPEGELTARFPRRIRQPGEVIVRSEAPRGELFYFVRNEAGTGPARVKIRTPTIPNMASVLHLTVGSNLADAPMILVGIDPCFSCNDRTSLIKGEHSSDKWTWESLRRYGIEYYNRSAI